MTPLFLSASLAVTSAVVGWEVDSTQLPPMGLYPDEYVVRVWYDLVDGKVVKNSYQGLSDSEPADVDQIFAGCLELPQWTAWRTGPLKVVVADLRGVKVSGIRIESNGPKPVVRPVFKKPDKK